MSEASTHPVLDISHLSVALPASGDRRHAVIDLSLTIKPGEIVCVVGESGSGKSTLLRMLAGFETPTAGRVWLADRDVTDLPPYERPMNMMFQSYALFPHMNVWDNVAFGLRRDGVAKDELNQRVEDMLQLVQLQ